MLHGPKRRKWRVPAITYTAEAFPSSLGGALAGTFTISVSWEEIVWAAISVGKAQFAHITQHGVFSTFEFIYRAAIIYANLVEDSTGRLRRSLAYDGLDSSEKGAISYFLGMTLTKLFANRLLGVPWLMHLDVYRQQLHPVLVGKSKPDFVGLNINNDWVVMEAKGRTNDYEESVLQKAKTQTQQLTTISGSQPVLRVASLTYFAAGYLEFAMRDPREGRSDKRIPDLPLTKREFVSTYYRPFAALLGENRSAVHVELDGRGYRGVPFPEFDLFIGLADEQVDIRPTVKDTPRGVNNGFVGSDGVFVNLGPIWSAEKMRLQPQMRGRE
jgi:hypothetical protein